MLTDERRWMLLRTFYQSYRSFNVLLEQYERRVLAFAERDGVDRSKLKLRPSELASLMDATALLALRDGELNLLRQISHMLFRSAHLVDTFDNNVTNIYHEVSILKEEHYAVGEETLHTDPKEYERYYREVNIYYPRRLRHVRDLFTKARSRLERLLPSMATNKIVLRSAYLFGDQLVRDVYPAGLGELYRHMYPHGGSLTGYTLAADSFLEGGFADEAARAYAKAINAVDDLVAAAKRRRSARGRNEAVALNEQRLNLEARLERALALTDEVA